MDERVFRHILFPLDGSRLAESALTTAVWLARAMDAQVTLVHIIEKNAPSEIHRDRHLVTPEEADTYLQEISRRPTLSGLRVETHVHTAEVGDVARSIAEHSAELAPDLVAMCTHGRGGARRLLFGVIAQQVISLGKTPVLMVRPSKGPQFVGTTGDFKPFLLLLMATRATRRACRWQRRSHGHSTAGSISSWWCQTCVI